MMESTESQVFTPPITKAKSAKLVKPNIATKPTFLKNQQFNKASNKKLMLITNKDGNLSVITNTDSPPIAPKPKSTFHLRVQQHGKKLQVCPVGHYIKVQKQNYSENNTKEHEVCPLHNELTWSTLQKKATKKNELGESCKIDFSEKVVNPLAVIPIPAPRKWNNNLDDDTEGRKSFENIRANFEPVEMQSKPVPSPRGRVNVKLQRILFEKMLCSKEIHVDEAQMAANKPCFHLDQNLASGQIPLKVHKSITPKKTTKSSSKTFTQRMASRKSKSLPSRQINKSQSRSIPPILTPKPSITVLPPGPISKSSSKALTSAKPSTSDISAESSIKANSPRPSPKPSPRLARSPVLTCKRIPELAPKPLPRGIPREPTSKQLSNAIPPELSPKVIPAEPSAKPILSKDILADSLSKSTDALPFPNKRATRCGARQDIPKIIVTDEANINIKKADQDDPSPVYIHCEHLEHFIIENEDHFDNTNESYFEEACSNVKTDSCIDDKPDPNTDVTPEISTTYVKPETSTTDVKPETSIADVKSETSTIDVIPETSTDVKPETSTDVKPETSTDVKLETSRDVGQEMDMNVESETYSDVILNLDRSEHSSKEPDGDDNDYANCDDDDDYINCNHDDYINGDFFTPAGEYMDFENSTTDCQSTVTEDIQSDDVTGDDVSTTTTTIPHDHTYINCAIPSEISSSDGTEEIQSDVTCADVSTATRTVPHDHIYINYAISSEISSKNCDSDGTEDSQEDLPSLKTKKIDNNNEDSDCSDGATTGSQCYEVILDVSSIKSPITTKYRRFSCRQPGRRRKSNFNKQSHLNIVNADDDGSEYKSSQEDVTEFSSNEIFDPVKVEEEVIAYSKDEFVDEIEEDEGWQSVDSSELDHDEDSRKRYFHHVLSITPEPAESGVSSGNPSPSRLSSATSDSQVTRVNSCVSFISSDGFEDGSVRSSISQFSLSDELEGINNCESFEEDELTDNELLEIMKRESTLSDGVPELDMEALKNDTMLHINKMRQKLAEMKRNVAHKNRPCVSLVSNDGLDLPENTKQSERTVTVDNDRNKQDFNQISDSNINGDPKGNISKRKLKEISWKQDLNHVSNYNRTNSSNVCHTIDSMKNSDDDRTAESQEESVESAIYISAELDDVMETNSRRLSMDSSYVDPDELTSTPRHQALRRNENRTSWQPGIDGAPPVPPRTPSLKLDQQTPNPSVHKTHSAGPVLQTQSKKSKKDFHSRRQSRFVRKEPLFQAYNKDKKLRDTLHITGKRKQLSVDRDSPPPLPPPRRQSSDTGVAKTGQHPHLMAPERRSLSFPEIDVENVNRKPSLKMQRTLWCEVPEVFESGILEQIDDKARKLQEAMFEVITSEASYLRSLDIFVNNFCKADVFNASYGLLRKEERHHLFSNLLSVRDASERLLLDLEDRFLENHMISDVCDIIIKHATQRNFDMYVTYCLNNQYQIKTLKSLRENPIFVTELGILERGKECGGNNLPSFIMMPFQRITRLPLLIEAIITRLEPDSDKISSATEALNLVKKVAMKCNEEARRMEGIEELTKLAHKLDYKPNIKAIKISDKLLIVKRGDLQWFSHDTSRFNKKKVVSKQIHILVFADKVVLTKRKIKNDREVFEVFDWCPRNLVDVKSVELKYDTLLPEEYKNVMMVVFLQNHEKKEKKYFINTTSDANFQRWSDALAPPNRSDQGESIYESWDCPQVMCTQIYSAQEPDELSMEESDVVDVLRKSEGWWEGMRVRDSAKGWFPANHVQEIVNDHVRARNLKHRYKVLSVCQEQLEKLQMQGKDLAFQS